MSVFRFDTQRILVLADRFWSERLSADRFDDELLSMLLLQMFHYVRHTIGSIDRALAALDQPDDEDFRALLEHLRVEEDGHEELVLQDLEKLGHSSERCISTLPLPTTLNVAAENRMSMELLGPYAYLGALLASEEGASSIAARVDVHCRDRRDRDRDLRFFRVHSPGSGHDRRTRDCVERYLFTQYRPILAGFIATTRNLMLLGRELQDFSIYPAPYRL